MELIKSMSMHHLPNLEKDGTKKHQVQPENCHKKTVYKAIKTSAGIDGSVKNNWFQEPKSLLFL